MKSLFGCVRSLGGTRRSHPALLSDRCVNYPVSLPRTGQKQESMIYWRGAALHPSCLRFHLDVALLFLPDSLFAFSPRSAGILLFLIKSQESVLLRTDRDQTGACRHAFILKRVRDATNVFRWLIAGPTEAHRDAGVRLCFLQRPSRHGSIRASACTAIFLCVEESAADTGTGGSSGILRRVGI